MFFSSDLHFVGAVLKRMESWPNKSRDPYRDYRDSGGKLQRPNRITGQLNAAQVTKD